MRHPQSQRKGSKLSRWSILAAVYATWNVVMYNVHHSVLTNKLPVVVYDYCYWIGERLFVVAAFWTVWITVEKKYQWIIGTLFWVATVKLLYLLLVIFQAIKANDFQSLMAVLFTAALGVIVLRWGK